MHTERRECADGGEAFFIREFVPSCHCPSHTFIVDKYFTSFSQSTIFMNELIFPSSPTFSILSAALSSIYMLTSIFKVVTLQGQIFWVTIKGLYKILHITSIFTLPKSHNPSPERMHFKWNGDCPACTSILLRGGGILSRMKSSLVQVHVLNRLEIYHFYLYTRRWKNHHPTPTPTHPILITNNFIVFEYTHFVKFIFFNLV